MKQEGKIDCYIIAGGKGTRLAPLMGDRPKCMVEISEKRPLLHDQIEKLLKVKTINNVRAIVAKDSGIVKKNRWKNTFILEEEQRDGTAGAIKKYYSRSSSDNILVIYGDILFNMDIEKLIKYHLNHDAPATLVVKPSNHVLDSDLVKIDNDKNITEFIKRPFNHETGREGEHAIDAYHQNIANAGIFIINKEVVDKIELGDDFSRDVWQKIDNKKAYYTTEYIKDIGTPQRYKRSKIDGMSGKRARSTLNQKRPAIFLDRDGVINKFVPLLHSWDKFKFMPGVKEAIKRINDAGWLAIMVSNQSVVARGICSLEDVEEIHQKMQWELGVYGTYLDAMYFCPHHPDSGFPEENKEYKIDCECRKPKIGMFKQALEDFNIDIENSWMIGDTGRDEEFANNCGIGFFKNDTQNLYDYVCRIIG